MTTFSPGHAGGGNVGFAFAAPTSLVIAVSERDRVALPDGGIWPDERNMLLMYVLDTWRATTGSNCNYTVVIESANLVHTGLASSAAIQAAAWSALNLVHSCPFDDTVLRRMIATAYSEVENGSLVRAFTTGLSSLLGIYGGFGVIAPDLRLVFHTLMPDWAAAIVAPRGATTVSFGDRERQTLTIDGAALDRELSSQKMLLLHDRLIPAAARADLPSLGNAISELQAIGSKVAEIAVYGRDVADLLINLRTAFPCAFMSAVGPGVAIVGDMSSEVMADMLGGFEVDVRWLGTIDNFGIRREVLSTSSNEDGRSCV